MRKTFFLWLLLAATIFANGQGSTLYRVNVVKPKLAMRSAFEASWITHLNQFHNTTDKRNVYEVVSGPELGSFVIVEGPFSYADMDKTSPTAKEHLLDLEKNYFPKLENTNGSFMVSWVDSLSFNGNSTAEKFLITTTVVKDGKLAGYLIELRRNVLIYTKTNQPFSLNILIKQQAGSNPTIVSIRNLKDGFKEMESGYFKLAPYWLRDAYIAEYGQLAWDNRLKLLVDDVVSREQHFEKIRPDLSSKK